MRNFCLLLLLLWPLAAPAQSFDPARLTEGGYVVYFRHTSAERGRDCKDASKLSWWQSQNPALTRQLDENGRQQAVRIGQSLKALGVNIDGIYCSEFRRAFDTANLFDLGEVVSKPGLTPLVYPGELSSRLNPLLESRPATGCITILVAHGHVLPMFSELKEGDAAVFRPGSQPLLQGYISLEKLLDQLERAKR